jgi:hypothetical protein
MIRMVGRTSDAHNKRVAVCNVPATRRDGWIKKLALCVDPLRLIADAGCCQCGLHPR